MKLIKTVIFIIQLCLIANSLLAQNVNIGLRAGLSHFTISKDAFDEDAKYMTGLSFAIPVEFELNHHLSLQPELQYIQKGVSFDLLEEGQDLKTISRTSYLELPILLRANLGSSRKGFHLYVGPSIGYAINRKNIIKVDGVDAIKTDINFIKDGAIQDQRWELAAVGGVGASLPFGPGFVRFDARYSYDLNDNIKFKNARPDTWDKSKNHGVNLSLGYLIPLARK